MNTVRVINYFNKQKDGLYSFEHDEDVYFVDRNQTLIIKEEPENINPPIDKEMVYTNGFRDFIEKYLKEEEYQKVNATHHTDRRDQHTIAASKKTLVRLEVNNKKYVHTSKKLRAMFVNKEYSCYICSNKKAPIFFTIKGEPLNSKNVVGVLAPYQPGGIYDVMRDEKIAKNEARKKAKLEAKKAQKAANIARNAQNSKKVLAKEE